MRIIPNKECRHIVKPKKILDRYLYSDRMLREEIIREYPDSSGNIAYAITRNSYGRAESLDLDSVSGLARLVRSFTILVSTIAPSTGVVKV